MAAVAAWSVERTWHREAWTGSGLLRAEPAPVTAVTIAVHLGGVSRLELGRRLVQRTTVAFAQGVLGLGSWQTRRVVPLDEVEAELAFLEVDVPARKPAS